MQRAILGLALALGCLFGTQKAHAQDASATQPAASAEVTPSNGVPPSLTPYQRVQAIDAVAATQPQELPREYIIYRNCARHPWRIHWPRIRWNRRPSCSLVPGNSPYVGDFSLSEQR